MSPELITARLRAFDASVDSPEAQALSNSIPVNNTDNSNIEIGFPLTAYNNLFIIFQFSFACDVNSCYGKNLSPVM